MYDDIMLEMFVDMGKAHERSKQWACTHWWRFGLRCPHGKLLYNRQKQRGIPASCTSVQHTVELPPGEL